MRFSNIIYFCDCYLIMLDYEEELANIIEDFVKKETNEKKIKLKKECEEILGIDIIMKVEETNKIIKNCANLDIEANEMLDILECVYTNL